VALYRVQPGDSPLSIAVNHTGCRLCARELVDANRHKPLKTVDGVVTFRTLRAGELLNLPAKWTKGSLGLGQSGSAGSVADTDIQSAFQQAYGQIPVPTATQNALNGFASSGALQGLAQGAMGSFAQGQVPDMTGMVSLAGTWPSSTALSPNLIQTANGLGVPPGAVAVALGVLAIASSPAVAAAAGVAIGAVNAIAGFFQGNPPPLPVPFCSVLGYQSDIKQNQSIPYGPTDHNWHPYPLKLGQETCHTSCPPAWGDSCGADASISTIDIAAWCDYQNAPPGSFDQFALAALLADFELGYNCQPNFVSPQKLIQACAAQWNAVHGPTPAFTLQPLEAQNVSNINDPTWLLGHTLEAIMGAALVFDTTQSALPIAINGGPLTAPSFNFSKSLSTILTEGAKPPATHSTATKVAAGAAGVAGAGALALFIYAEAKGIAFEKAGEKLWDKTKSWFESKKGRR
jgi:hypothetical protein